jgi:hypothetical protein
VRWERSYTLATLPSRSPTKTLRNCSRKRASVSRWRSSPIAPLGNHEASDSSKWARPRMPRRPFSSSMDTSSRAAPSRSMKRVSARAAAVVVVAAVPAAAAAAAAVAQMMTGQQLPGPLERRRVDHQSDRRTYGDV